MSDRRFVSMKTRSQKRNWGGNVTDLIRFRLRWWFATFLVLSAGTLTWLDIKIRPAIAASASAVATRAATDALNDAILEELVGHDAPDSLVTTDAAADGTIRMAHFDMKSAAAVQSGATLLAERELSSLTKQTLHVPLGQIVGGSILSSLGPSVPVKVYLVGSAHTSVGVQTESVGINQTIHQLVLTLEANVQVVAPLVTEPVHIQVQSPMAYVVLNGPVPEGYVGQGGSSSSPWGVPSKP